MNLYSKKIAEEFIEETLKKGFYASKEEIAEVLKEMESILTFNKDKNLEEVVDILLDDLNSKVTELINRGYPIPGYNIEINSGLISASLYGGSLDEKGTPMTKDAIFDIASITKLFTQIISYNLIRESYYSFDSKISDLHPRFKNADNLDVKTIMNFSFAYNIDGKIENATSVEEAKSILYTLGVREKDVYKYIDFGMICLKEVMEHVTGKSFEQLVKEYIIDKLGLENTYLNIPENKLHLVTGTPNAHLGRNNDMKAIKLGGFSGNSGVLSDSKGIIEVVKNLYVNNSFFPHSKLSDVYTQSRYSKEADEQRGVMGNTCCTLGGSFIDKLSPFDASTYQGSTRTQLNAGTYNGILTTSSILLNPASMGLERARKVEEQLNKEFVTEYRFENIDYKQMSAQKVLPTGEIVKPLTHETAKLSLRLAFLNTLIKNYDPSYTDKIRVERDDNFKCR